MTFFDRNPLKDQLHLERISRDSYALGKTIYHARFNQGYSQQEIADILEIPVEDLLDIESGNSKNDSSEIVKLVTFLEIPSQQIPDSIKNRLNEIESGNIFV